MVIVVDGHQVFRLDVGSQTVVCCGKCLEYGCLPTRPADTRAFAENFFEGECEKDASEKMTIKEAKQTILDRLQSEPEEETE